MKKYTSIIFIMGIVLTGLIISGCTEKTSSNEPLSYISTPETALEISIRDALINPLAFDTVQISGRVNQTIDVPGYTLIEINDTTGSLWIAGTSNMIENGSQITAMGSLNTGFHSATLNRTFEVLLLAESISDGNTTISDSPHGSSGPIITDVNVSAIEGGTRIQEILEDPASFNGKEVKVAAVVIKDVVLIDYSMLTIDDGTGQLKARSPNSLVFTNGENIVVTGTISTDVDLGSGYQYDILLEISAKE